MTMHKYLEELAAVKARKTAERLATLPDDHPDVLRARDAKLEADARALWAVRVLDAWAMRVSMRAIHVEHYGAAGAHPGWSCRLWLWGSRPDVHCFAAAPDAARIAAAEALVAEHPERPRSLRRRSRTLSRSWRSQGQSTISLAYSPRTSPSLPQRSTSSPPRYTRGPELTSHASAPARSVASSSVVGVTRQHLPGGNDSSSLASTDDQPQTIAPGALPIV
jgi:hypothetical protein